MRTTLNLKPEAASLARELAALQGRPLGDVVSDLVLEAARRPRRPTKARNGFPQLNAGGDAVITLELVKALQDDEG